MITNTGKEIIAKYLMGVAPAYASYIAVGCGAKPRPNITTISGASSATVSTITTVTVGNTAGLWVGAKITKISGTGTLSTTENTIVTSINNNGTQFVISPSPTVELSGATISIEIDPSEKVLDFEMFRVPISSRGYINDDGVNKIVFTAELPSEERYEISEIGLYSAGSNPSAGSYDSKTLYAFTDSENWQFNNASPVSITNSITPIGNDISSTADAIQTFSNNTAFLNATRSARYERCRYYNNIIMTRGNSSYISSNAGVFSVDPSFKSLQLTPATLDLSKNSTSDLIKIAFSIVSVIGDSTLYPDAARVMVEFSSSDETQYARFNAEALHTQSNFLTNRYMVIQKRLDQLSYSNTFSWSAMSVVKIYTSTINNYTITTKAYSASPTPTVTLTTSAAHNLKPGDVVSIPISMGTGYSGTFTLVTASGSTFTYVPTVTPGAGAGSLSIGIEAASSQYFIALDSIRLDNVGTINPLYGMTGYTIIQNATAETITKSANSNNYIEFRVVVDVT
jgi:hypothetical protein